MGDFQHPYNPQSPRQFPRTMQAPMAGAPEPQINGYAAGGTMVYLDNGEMRPATLPEVGRYMRGAR